MARPPTEGLRAEGHEAHHKTYQISRFLSGVKIATSAPDSTARRGGRVIKKSENNVCWSVKFITTASAAVVRKKKTFAAGKL